MFFFMLWATRIMKGFEMHKTFFSAFKTFVEFLRRDIYVMRFGFRDRLINGAIFALISITMHGHIMPHLGISRGFGLFMLAGNMVSQMIFQAMSLFTELSNDFQDKREVAYYLSMPTYSTLTFLRYVCINTYKSALVSGVGALVSVIVLWDRLSFPNLSIVRIALAVVLIGTFLGFSALFLAGHLSPEQGKFENVWARITAPFWFSGGYFFTHSLLSEHFPYIARLLLLNPITYAMEGMRAAVFGDEGYINFWVSMAALGCFTLLISVMAVRSIKKRVDAV